MVRRVMNKIFLAVVTLGIGLSALAEFKVLPPREVRIALQKTKVNTNIVATAQVVSTSSNSVTLTMQAVGPPGEVILGYDIFRNGQWIDRVVVTNKPPSPVSVTMDRFVATGRVQQLMVGWAPYKVPWGCSNAVIVIYKATSLGTVFTPSKPTAYFPASRTNGIITVLAGQTYRFHLTAQADPLGESDPSETVTLIVPQ